MKFMVSEISQVHHVVLVTSYRLSMKIILGKPHGGISRVFRRDHSINDLLM